MKNIILFLLMLSILFAAGCTYKGDRIEQVSSINDNTAVTTTKVEQVSSISGNSIATNVKAFSYVIDTAQILDVEQREDLVKLCSGYENKTKVQISALIVNSTNGQSIDDFSIEQFNKLGIGQKQTNNGALIVIAIKDRTARITLGYGLEWCINDNISEEIFNMMVPSLREDKIYDALLTGFNEVIKYTENTSWDITYTETSKALSAKENARKKILSVKVQSMKEDGSYLTVNTCDGYKILLNTTKYMNDLVNTINDGDAIVTGRIKTVEPLSIDLLSVEKS